MAETVGAMESIERSFNEMCGELRRTLVADGGRTLQPVSPMGMGGRKVVMDPGEARHEAVIRTLVGAVGVLFLRVKALENSAGDGFRSYMPPGGPVGLAPEPPDSGHLPDAGISSEAHEEVVGETFGAGGTPEPTARESALLRALGSPTASVVAELPLEAPESPVSVGERAVQD